MRSPTLPLSSRAFQQPCFLAVMQISAEIVSRVYVSLLTTHYRDFARTWEPSRMKLILGMICPDISARKIDTI
jgi:predicted signal transduction protein with EAL and GGDEF domain